MRLCLSASSVATAALLIGQLTHTTLGFSNLPATSLRRPTTTTPLASTTQSETADIQKILETLEKRVLEGPGSLSLMEVEEFKIGSDRILMELKKNEADGAVPVKAAASPAVPEQVSPVEVTPPPNEVVVTNIPGDDGVTYDMDDLRIAASRMDSTMVTKMINSGMQMDEETTNAAFWTVVQAVDRAEEMDQPLSADVPIMLHHIFDADLQHLIGREKITLNVTCKQPEESGLTTHGMNYIFDDSSHKDLPLIEGRRCEGGTCCDACSRNIYRTFASEAECSLQTFPDLSALTFNNLERVSSASIIQFTRLIERVRRTIAYEYGLPLSTILPLQAYSRKYVAGTTQQGGGGGEGDHVILHTDEATHDGYHYSCVLYLSTQGEDFEGGDFVFNDPVEEGEEDATSSAEEGTLSLEEAIRRTGRKLTPFHPTRGAAVIFSSGWENMHEVEQITSGTRYAVPCFFTTCPVPEAAYTQMVAGKPKTNEGIADDWLHLLLAHRKEKPEEAVGRVKELLMKWHYMCTPLSEH